MNKDIKNILDKAKFDQPILFICKNAIVKNLKYFQKKSAKIAPVIKADAYNIGIKNIVPILIENNINEFFTHSIDEAKKLDSLLRKYISTYYIHHLSGFDKKFTNIYKKKTFFQS